MPAPAFMYLSLFTFQIFCLFFVYWSLFFFFCLHNIYSSHVGREHKWTIRTFYIYFKLRFILKNAPKTTASRWCSGAQMDVFFICLSTSVCDTAIIPTHTRARGFIKRTRLLCFLCKITASIVFQRAFGANVQQHGWNLKTTVAVAFTRDTERHPKLRLSSFLFMQHRLIFPPGHSC